MLTNRDVLRLAPGSLVIVDDHTRDAVRATVALYPGTETIADLRESEFAADVRYYYVNTVELGPVSQDALHHLSDEGTLVTRALERTKTRIAADEQRRDALERRLVSIKNEQRAAQRASKKAAVAKQFPCPECKTPQEPGALVCLNCGAVFDVTSASLRQEKGIQPFPR